MTINIALGFDANFAEHAGVTIKSILMNNNSDIKFYLMIDDSVSFFDKLYIKKMILQHKNKVVFINMSEKFNGLFTGTWSKAMYYPILLTEICEEEKILFFDSDIIVNKNLIDLYNTDIENYYCAAVQDNGMLSWIKSKHEIQLSNNSKISIDKYFSEIRHWNHDDLKRYFNSGMLLFNLQKMRKDNITQKLFNILENEILACPDQDCFNICFHDKVKILKSDYNFMILNPDVYENLDKDEKDNYDSVIKFTNTPTVIHFLDKPWINSNHKVPFSELYYKYRNFTIWKYKIEKKCIKKIIRLKLSIKEVYLFIFGKQIFNFKKTFN